MHLCDRELLRAPCGAYFVSTGEHVPLFERHADHGYLKAETDTILREDWRRAPTTDCDSLELLHCSNDRVFPDIDSQLTGTEPSAAGRRKRARNEEEQMTFIILIYIN